MLFGRTLVDGKVVFTPPSGYIVKFRLPREWRTSVLTALAQMNITGDTLFPGLDGLGRATDLHLQTGAPASLTALLGF